MARTPRQLAALGVTIALALSSGSSSSLSNGLGPDELGIELDGKKLFDEETFGGNGRTCLTCHSKRTGTLGVRDVQRIIKKGDPNNAFLTFDALDDDGGTTRVREHATIRVTIPLPPWVSLADDPGATHVTVFRGIPSTRNTPALDPVLNYDGRPATVQEQALGADSRPLPEHRRTDGRAARRHRRIPANGRRASSPRVRSGSSPLVGRRLSCPLEGRRLNGEDASSLLTRPSALLQRRASAPCVIAVRC